MKRLKPSYKYLKLNDIISFFLASTSGHPVKIKTIYRLPFLDMSMHFLFTAVGVNVSGLSIALPPWIFRPCNSPVYKKGKALF